MVEPRAKRIQLESHLNERKEGLLFLQLAPISFCYECVEISWYHEAGFETYSLFLTQSSFISGLGCTISVDYWFMILFSPKLEELNKYKLHKIRPVSCSESVQAAGIFCPASQFITSFYLHNCSLKILDNGLTSNACLFPPTQTKRLNTIIIIPKRKTRKKATRKTTADGFAEGEEVNITCIKGALWAKRGPERGIAREAQDGGERAFYAE